MHAEASKINRGFCQLYSSQLYVVHVTVSPERRGTSHHRSQAVRAHHASPTSAALATSPLTSEIQAIYPRLPFVGRYCSCIPS